MATGETDTAIKVITLGPEGTCHERAVQHYLDFQGIDECEVELTTDLFAGLDTVRKRPNTFLVQCSAHPKVHEITEKYWTEVFVVDTFIYPTKHLVLLSRKEVERPRSLGIVPRDQGLRRPLAVGADRRRAVEADRRGRADARRVRLGPHA